MARHDLNLSSLVIHGGQHPDPSTGAVMPPVSLSSTYAQQSPGEHQGYEYSRSHNPTRYALERCIASIERTGLTETQHVTCGGFAFSSGLAAMATLLELIDHGNEIVAMDDLYGGSYRLMTNIRERSQGLRVKYVDMTNRDALSSAVTDKTKMIWVETPTNPTLKLVDLAFVADLGRKHNALTVCDNTFATPLLQRPLEYGFDLILHSATKYLGGHSDVVGGVVATSRLDLAEKLSYMQNAIGSVLGPFDAYLILRGIKTLAVRMRQHCASAQRIAEWLEQQEGVEQVIYPGLRSHPQYELGRRQMQLDGAPAAGGIITAYLRGGLEPSRRFLENLEVFALAESLGGVESLIEHPAIMTHASVPPQNRAALGITDNLVRISVGIEDTDDLIADLRRALDAMKGARVAASTTR